MNEQSDCAFSVGEIHFLQRPIREALPERISGRRWKLVHRSVAIVHECFRQAEQSSQHCNRL